MAAASQKHPVRCFPRKIRDVACRHDCYLLALIVLASLSGGWLPLAMRLSHTRMQIMMSFVAGLMLGVAILHLLPHAVAELDDIDVAVRWTLIGMLGMFFLVRAFHFHQHLPDEEAPAACAHEHHHDHGGHEHSPASNSRLHWIGVAIGLALHTAIDGMALAANVLAESEHLAGGVLFGVGTFLAIALHKPLDALTITVLMKKGGWSRAATQLVNASFALMCPLGALLFWFGTQEAAGQKDLVVGIALAFSAGVFLCIALGDLMPELQFHSHDRLKLSAALLLGVALAYGIGFLEPSHVHSAGHESHEQGHEHGGHAPGMPHS